MPGPAATIGSMHVCPMLNPGTPPPPHVGGPVSGPGVPTVLIGGKPAAVMGDMCTCAGPPDTIVQGEATVLIGGKPAATVGSMTAHGGSITVGEPTVLIGTGGSGATAITPVKRIPFPKISPLLKAVAAVTGRGTSLKEAQQNQEKLKEEAEKDTLELTNLVWKQDGKQVEKALIGQTVELTADVSGADEGASISLEIVDVAAAEGEKEIRNVGGVVADQKISIAWKVDYPVKKKNADDSDEQTGYIEPELVFRGTTTNTSEVESGRLAVFTWLKVLLREKVGGNILKETKCYLVHPDDSEEELVSDAEGYVVVDELKIGDYRLTLKNQEDDL